MIVQWMSLGIQLLAVDDGEGRTFYVRDEVALRPFRDDRDLNARLAERGERFRQWKLFSGTRSGQNLDGSKRLGAPRRLGNDWGWGCGGRRGWSRRRAWARMMHGHRGCCSSQGGRCRLRRGYWCRAGPGSRLPSGLSQTRPMRLHHFRSHDGIAEGFAN